MNKTRKTRGGQNNMSRRNRVRAMMMKPYSNAAKVANAEMGSTNDPAGLKNMGKGFMNAMKTMRNEAGQKLRNVGQTLKNKYNTTMTKAVLNDEFFNRPNVAGMKPGAASRNLIKVANNQRMKREARNRQIRNRKTGMSSGNKYQAASMATSLFF
jgi:hypothetical protein